MAQGTIKIISDIHLEFTGALDSLPEIVPNTKVLALLGDIGNPLKPAYKQFLYSMCDKFSHVIVVAGNHEYYANEYNFTNQLIADICKERENLHFLQKSALEIDDLPDIRILGTTMWSYSPPEFEECIQSSSTDHSKIITQLDPQYLPTDLESIDLGKHWETLQIHGKKFEFKEKINFHLDQVKWLENEIEKAHSENKKIVVLTHHAPTSENSLPYHVRTSRAISDSFTNLHYLFKENVIMWGFGHTHYNCDIVFNNTRVISNQLGYVRRTNPTFDGSLVIDLLVDNIATLSQICDARQLNIEKVQHELDAAEEAKHNAPKQVEEKTEN